MEVSRVIQSRFTGILTLSAAIGIVVAVMVGAL